MKAMPSYLYGDPAEALDRKRAADRRKARAAGAKRRTDVALAEEELKLVPASWLDELKRGS